jgi:hypothetical protein
MTLQHSVGRYDRVITRSMTGTLLLSMGLLLALMLGISGSWGSRLALLLQAAVLLTAMMRIRVQARRSWRWVGYPLLLASAIYLWDVSLPPPTLPHGVLRTLVPKLVMVGILSHMLLRARPQPIPAQRRVRVLHGYSDLVEVADLFGRSPAMIRDRLRPYPLAIYVADDGCEYVSLIMVLALLDDHLPQGNEGTSMEPWQAPE